MCCACARACACACVSARTCTCIFVCSCSWPRACAPRITNARSERGQSGDSVGERAASVRVGINASGVVVVVVIVIVVRCAPVDASGIGQGRVANDAVGVGVTKMLVFDANEVPLPPAEHFE